MKKKTKARRPAKGALTYYRVRRDTLYWQDPTISATLGPRATARLYPSRASTSAIESRGDVIEPVRVTALTSAKRNKHRNR